MRAASRFHKIQGAFNRRISFFRQCQAKLLIDNDRASNAWGAHVIIELDNLIISTFREFLVSSNFGAKTLSGRWTFTAVPPFPSDAHLSAQALSIVNSVKYRKLGRPVTIDRRDEHKFRNPRDVRRVLASLGGSNLSELDTALSLNTTLFSDIAVLRNFYAHRNRDTWRAASDYFVTRRAYPRFKNGAELLSYRHPSSSASVIAEWLTDAELFFDFALQ
ncbi:hypothetical protein RX327_07740 [Bradyrhizobium sp. BEA-2-5]|uniref:hypothetical protein n=1 Tax=Bradyrhizobium sp. BEA-2-5 TaxID=3080015 RepID=UPI00293F1187|nr:hypothetical protein [Bradyrhizobium sp. BEA-2-5]WOH83031.1 hypothetical protein RX327_07740 [Bradyrhizobium sp. BEA-2-5]